MIGFDGVMGISASKYQSVSKTITLYYGVIGFIYDPSKMSGSTQFGFPCGVLLALSVFLQKSVETTHNVLFMVFMFYTINSGRK